ncbi:conserved hypothetical protein [Luminiphilus syltensis NOR5-1B]|uniref:Uncharacterized protein n=1 Tax=Luminiphilus syltensis NOR5-1B TaxID=565045 RepID=B8KVQ5_9GAMM|nr:hypothetical protein [Luminiphilus syltensis]EED34862.1 conserved hypothetical protein [Luminiphilus syltensis NOR5-1B]
MLTWTRRLFLTGVILSLLITNLLTLTSVAFNAALSGVISTAAGVQTVADVMSQRLTGKDKVIKQQKSAAVKRTAAVRKFGTRLSVRTKRVATRSVAAIPAEAIPYLGIAALIGGTAYELYEACQSIKDLDELYGELGLDEAASEGAIAAACNPQLPNPTAVWESVKGNTDTWLESAAEQG